MRCSGSWLQSCGLAPQKRELVSLEANLSTLELVLARPGGVSLSLTASSEAVVGNQTVAPHLTFGLAVRRHSDMFSQAWSLRIIFVHRAELVVDIVATKVRLSRAWTLLRVWTHVPCLEEDSMHLDDQQVGLGGGWWRLQA